VSEYLWHCPFCNKDQTVTDEGMQATFADLTIDNADGPRRSWSSSWSAPVPRAVGSP
jgi:hypothetical protein